jgi:hypothetical protein
MREKHIPGAIPILSFVAGCLTGLIIGIVMHADDKPQAAEKSNAECLRCYGTDFRRSPSINGSSGLMAGSGNQIIYPPQKYQTVKDDPFAKADDDMRWRVYRPIVIYGYGRREVRSGDLVMFPGNEKGYATSKQAIDVYRKWKVFTSQRAVPAEYTTEINQIPAPEGMWRKYDGVLLHMDKNGNWKEEK